ncbi:unknown [Firmicutes bacterium CAG:475]|nr:unknown [Firmicutes bacterium CAG:475]
MVSSLGAAPHFLWEKYYVVPGIVRQKFYVLITNQATSISLF